MLDVIGIIQARLSSSRLPGKILAPLAGRPLLAVLAARLASARVAEWWLATTHERDDDVTAAWGEALGLHVARGDRDDVLSRFTGIIRRRRPDWIVRITADDPFVDGAIVNRLLDAASEASKQEPDISLVGIAGDVPVFPLGYVPQMARARDVLDSEGRIAPAEGYHRSHVLSWLRCHARSWDAPPPHDWPRRPQWRWTVDTADDLRMARAAFAVFGESWAQADYPQMVAALDACPEIPELNLHVRQKDVTEG